MKSNSPLSFYITDNPMKVLNHESSGQQTQSKSPYLKAILSGNTKSFTHENRLPDANPDRTAAIRYIKESSLLKKI
jgi:hypothetical protein